MTCLTNCMLIIFTNEKWFCEWVLWCYLPFLSQPKQQTHKAAWDDCGMVGGTGLRIYKSFGPFSWFMFRPLWVGHSSIWRPKWLNACGRNYFKNISVAAVMRKIMIDVLKNFCLTSHSAGFRPSMFIALVRSCNTNRFGERIPHTDWTCLNLLQV